MTRSIPHADTAAYRAAAFIYKSGPLPRAELFAKVHFSELACNSSNMLRVAIGNGWLAEQSGVIALTDVSRVHFGGIAADAEPKYIGEVATSRATNVFEGKPLSKKHIPSARGTRDGVPAFSLRDKPSFKSVAGCKS